MTSFEMKVRADGLEVDDIIVGAYGEAGETHLRVRERPYAVDESNLSVRLEGLGYVRMGKGKEVTIHRPIVAVEYPVASYVRFNESGLHVVRGRTAWHTVSDSRLSTSEIVENVLSDEEVHESITQGRGVLVYQPE